jgi:hypothetical protein
VNAQQRPHQVGASYYADDLSVTKDRKSLRLPVFHEPDDFIKLGVFGDRDGIRCHDLFYGQPVGVNVIGGGGGLGNAFDRADRQRGSAEHGHEIDRQQPVDHLRGDVHEKRYKPKRPDAGRNRAQRLQVELWRRFLHDAGRSACGAGIMKSSQ